MDEEKKLWKKCVDFHGHVCGGLTIGYKASLYAMDLLNLGFSKDEDVVCITENDACGIDAIQVILGCSAGKGNLLFKLRGKQAFSFYDRQKEKSIRLVLKAQPKMTKEESQVYLMDSEASELFDVKETTSKIPEKAKIFHSYPCAICGEVTAESMVRLEKGQKVCLDCYTHYTRSI